MKKFVVISCFLCFILLMMGCVLSLPSIQSNFSQIIPSQGRIVSSPEASQSQQADYPPQSDQIGYLAIFVSIGFFIVAFRWMLLFEVIVRVLIPRALLMRITGPSQRMTKIVCPTCGVQGHLQKRRNSYRIQHYLKYTDGKKVQVTIE